MGRQRQAHPSRSDRRRKVSPPGRRDREGESRLGREAAARLPGQAGVS